MSDDQPLSDAVILSWVTTKNQQLSTQTTPQRPVIYADSFRYCHTDGGQTLLIYGIPRGGGGGGNDTYIGILDSNNTLTPETKIPPVLGEPYYSCNRIIMLTKENSAYIQCGAGDGGLATAEIYSIDFNNATYTRRYRCHGGRDYPVSCE